MAQRTILDDIKDIEYAQKTVGGSGTTQIANILKDYFINPLYKASEGFGEKLGDKTYPYARGVSNYFSPLFNSQQETQGGVITANKSKVEEAPTINVVARPAPAAKTEPTKAQASLGRANDSVFGAGNVLIGVKQLLESGVPERDIAEALASIKRGGEAEGLEGQSLKDYYKSLF